MFGSHDSAAQTNVQGLGGPGTLPRDEFTPDKERSQRFI